MEGRETLYRFLTLNEKTRHLPNIKVIFTTAIVKAKNRYLVSGEILF